MTSPHHEGIAARKANTGKHENPYDGQQVGFSDFLFNPRIFRATADAIYEWNRGWDAEDKWQRSCANVAVSHAPTDSRKPKP